MTLLDEAVVLNDGNLMPKVGTITADEPSINQAIKSGYRLMACPAGQKITW